MESTEFDEESIESSGISFEQLLRDVSDDGIRKNLSLAYFYGKRTCDRLDTMNGGFPIYRFLVAAFFVAGFVVMIILARFGGIGMSDIYQFYSQILARIWLEIKDSCTFIANHYDRRPTDVETGFQSSFSDRESSTDGSSIEQRDSEVVGEDLEAYESIDVVEE